MSAQDRFAKYLRDEARIADERSAQADDAGEGVQDIAERNTRASDRLRALADNVRSMSAAEREQLEQMSDEQLRALAKATRFYDPEADT